MSNSNSGNVPAVLTYEGALISQRDQMLSLTDMWRAATSPEAKRPVEWLRSKQAEEFIAHVELMVGNSHLSLVKIKKGVGGSTFAHWQIALAYAKYLSPEFHMWCNVVVRERMEGKSVAVSGISQELKEEIDRTFGICKMLAHKVTEIERAIPTIINQSVESALSADPRRALLCFVSVRELLDEAKSIQKKRRGLSKRVGDALRELAATGTGPGRAYRSAHSNVWMFHRDLADEFMKGRGATLVKEHNDRATGQGVLKLVAKTKPEATDPMAAPPL